MQKITPHLWFDRRSRDALALYTGAFENSRVKSSTTLGNTPSGSVEIVVLELAGQTLQCLFAGPEFKFTPAVSFLAACATKEETEALWNRLSEGGNILMPFASYPFSELYGWCQDRYGLSWQVMFVSGREIEQKITPTLMFTGANCGKAEEAMRFYTSLFPDSAVGHVARYGAGEIPETEGTVKYGAFTLAGQNFVVMDSARAHPFAFNEAISFIVRCEDQQEVDRYWAALSADPSAEQCGWLKDRYGLSWQIVPNAMDEMMKRGSPEQMARVTQAFLKMKKFDIATLQRAFDK
jgi:predicted 3-demethylubiquinone-9 3-methyltransferase (glyoxalase superfamily)